MKMNKKGAEMTIGTIIIIILAVIVLVILVYGFSTGWSNLWQKIIGLGGGKENVQSTIQACQVACTSNAKYDWCTLPRDVKADSAIFPADSTGKLLSKTEQNNQLGPPSPTTGLNFEKADKVAGVTSNALFDAKVTGFTECPALAC